MNAIDYCFLQLAKISKVGRLVDVDFKNLIRRYSESKSIQKLFEGALK
jgi:hypothetical protein